MLTFLKEMQRIGLGQEITTAWRTEESVFELEITDNVFAPKLINRPYEVTRKKNRTREIWPAYFADWLTYLKYDSNRSVPFWDQTFKSLRLANAPQEVIDALEKYRDVLTKAQLKFTKGKTKSYFRALDEQGNEVGERLAEKATFVLTFKGTPLYYIPEVKNWWEKNAKNIIVESSKKKKSQSKQRAVFDLVTGESLEQNACLWNKIKAYGVTFSLVAFQEAVYCLEKFSQGENFPVADETQLAAVKGFQQVFENSTFKATESGSGVQTVGWWGSEDLGQEVLHTLDSILKKVYGPSQDQRAQNQLDWKRLAELKSSGLVHFAAWRTALGRFALLDRWSVPFEVLKENLLRLREKYLTSLRIANILMYGEDQVERFFTIGNYLSVGTDSGFSERFLNGMTIQAVKEITTTGSATQPQRGAYQGPKSNLTHLYLQNYFFTENQTELEKDMTTQEPTFDLLGELTGVAKQQAIYGCLIALLEAFRGTYHHGTKNMPSLFPRYSGNVELFLTVGMRDASLYLNKVKEGYLGFKYKDLWQRLIAELNIPLLREYTQYNITGVKYYSMKYYLRQLREYNRAKLSENEYE